MLFFNKLFNELTAKELFEIYKARVAIFVVEQNCPYQEVDDTDTMSRHLFLCNEGSGSIKAYLRIFMKDENTVQIGRVLTTERGKNYGFEVMKNAVEYILSEIKPDEIYLEAQVYAVGFYEKFGFQTFGEEFSEDGIPHIRMHRQNFLLYIE